MKTSLVILCLSIAALVTTAHAEGGYLDQMLARYNIPNDSKLNSCSTCHGGGLSRNAYGQQLETAGAATDLIAAFAATDTLDADNDDARNWVELVNGTWPADPNDFVPVENTTWGRLKALFGR